MQDWVFIIHSSLSSQWGRWALFVFVCGKVFRPPFPHWNLVVVLKNTLTGKKKKKKESLKPQPVLSVYRELHNLYRENNNRGSIKSRKLSYLCFYEMNILAIFTTLSFLGQFAGNLHINITTSLLYSDLHTAPSPSLIFDREEGRWL